MAKLLKLRRGTTTQHGSFAGAEGEVTVDTTKDVVVVHTGGGAGTGVPMAKETAVPAVINSDTFSGASTSNVNSATGTKNYIDTQVATKQTSDADLTAIAGLTSAADKGIQFTGSGTAGTYDLTAFAKTILDDADAAAVRTTIGAQASDADLTAIAGLTSAADKGIQFTGSGTAGVYDLTAFAKTILDDADAAAVRTTIGAGTGSGDATLSGTQTFSGTKSFDAVKVAKGAIHDIGSSPGATITIDFANGNNQKVTLSANFTLAEPSNQVAGQSGSIFFIQPGGANYSISAIHADWLWPGGTDGTLTATNGAVDRLDYIILADNSVHAVMSKAMAA